MLAQTPAWQIRFNVHKNMFVILLSVGTQNANLTQEKVTLSADVLKYTPNQLWPGLKSSFS